jgi:hypothetical protein
MIRAGIASSMVLIRPYKAAALGGQGAKCHFGTETASLAFWQNGAKSLMRGLIRTEFYIPSTVSKLNDPEQATTLSHSRTPVSKLVGYSESI